MQESVGLSASDFGSSFVIAACYRCYSALLCFAACDWAVVIADSQRASHTDRSTVHNLKFYSHIKKFENLRDRQKVAKISERWEARCLVLRKKRLGKWRFSVRAESEDRSCFSQSALESFIRSKKSISSKVFLLKVLISTGLLAFLFNEVRYQPF